MRQTHALVQVAMALLDDPRGRHWGYGLSRKSGVRSGVLYPILTRMLDDGWLTDRWVEAGAVADQRLPRRYYRLTAKGKTQATRVLDEARTDRRFAALFSEPEIAKASTE